MLFATALCAARKGRWPEVIHSLWSVDSVTWREGPCRDQAPNAPPVGHGALAAAVREKEAEDDEDVERRVESELQTADFDFSWVYPLRTVAWLSSNPPDGWRGTVCGPRGQMGVGGFGSP